MKSSVASLFTVVAAAAFSSAHPALIPRAPESFNEMQDTIRGSAKCAAVGVIFARGTFDPGNSGPWVGPQWKDALASRIKSLAFQGVDSTAYLADLQGYLGEAGSNAGSASLAKTVTEYSTKCPDSTIIVSGWSQGALVAHKGLAQLSPDVQKKVAALVTFGDPQRLFTDVVPGVPTGVAFNTQCFKGTVLDPLCADIRKDFALPTSIDDIVGPFSKLPSFAVGAQQAQAAASLVAKFPGQLSAAGNAVKDTLKTKPQRLLLTPQHFQYGNNGLTNNAADFVAGLPGVEGK